MRFTIHPDLPAADNGALVFPDGEKTAWFKDSEGNILALGSSELGRGQAAAHAH